MLTFVAIAIGGTLGCWARYVMTNLVQTVYGRDFPYATLSINLLGAFLMGFLFVETLERLTISPILRTGYTDRRAGRLHDLFYLRHGIVAAGGAG